jgi:hypothetical protein
MPKKAMKRSTPAAKPTSRPLDFLFEGIVLSATDESYEGADLTVVLGGVVITGRLIPPAEYFKAASGNDPEFSASIDEDLQKGRKRPRRKQYRPEFFHLADAQIVTGTALIPTDAGMLWRGRVDDVAGFSLNRLSRQ